MYVYVCICLCVCVVCVWQCLGASVIVSSAHNLEMVSAPPGLSGTGGGPTFGHVLTDAVLQPQRDIITVENLKREVHEIKTVLSEMSTAL